MVDATSTSTPLIHLHLPTSFLLLSIAFSIFLCHFFVTPSSSSSFPSFLLTLPKPCLLPVTLLLGPSWFGVALPQCTVAAEDGR